MTTVKVWWRRGFTRAGALAASGSAALAMALAGAQPAPPGADASPRPLTVEETVAAGTFPDRAPIALSPDGDRVAFVVEHAPRAVGSTRGLLAHPAETRTEVRIADLRGGPSRPVMDAPGSSWAPSWSPDGSRLAFLSTRDGAPRVWIRDRETGRVWRASEAVVWSWWLRTAPRWTPDGRRVVVKLLPEDRTLAEWRRLASSVPSGTDGAPGTTVRLFSSRPGDDRPGRPALDWLPFRYGGDLALLDVGSGAVRRLTTDRVPFWFAPSRDGTWLGFLELADPRRPTGGFRLSVLPLDGGEPRTLPGMVRQGWGEAASWSPVEPRIAYVSAGEGDDGGVFIADAVTGTRHRLVPARPGWAEPHRGPLWTPDGSGLLFSGGGALWRVGTANGGVDSVAAWPERSIVDVAGSVVPGVAWGAREWAVVRTAHGETGATGLARVDLASGRARSLHEAPGRIGGRAHTRGVPGTTTGVTRFSTTRQPPDLWALDGELAPSRRITDLDPAFRSARLGESRLVRWTTADGDSLAGTLLLPPGHDPGDPLPVIVDVYGGSLQSRELHAFSRGRQLLASRGYAVFAPDAPLDVGTPMEDHARTILPGIDRLVRLGIADPDRLGVMGHSYGGYGTLALLVETDRFAAAVASAAHGNMTGMFGHLHADGSASTTWAERGQGRMGGTPWEVRDRYVENSPIYVLDRVHTPLLLLHGAEDRNTPAYLAGQVFTGLRRLGRTVVFVRYEGERHWPGMWSPANQADRWRRVLGWFDEWLGRRAGRDAPRESPGAGRGP